MGENSGVSVLGGALYENMNVCSARRCFENRGIFSRVPVIDDKIFTLCHGGVSAPRVDIPAHCSYPSFYGNILFSLPVNRFGIALVCYTCQGVDRE